MSVPITVMVVVGPWPGRESLFIHPRALSLAWQSAVGTQEPPTDARLCGTGRGSFSVRLLCLKSNQLFQNN